MFVSHALLSGRPLLVLFRPKSTPPYPSLLRSAITLAGFLSRQPRSSNRSQRYRRSQSQPPEHHIRSQPAHRNPEILPVNQANTQEAIYASISSAYQTHPPRNVTLIPAPEDHEHHTPPRYNPHPIPVQSGELHCYFPNNFYISSVLPTRTPRELRYFQDHCWKQYKDPQYPRTHFVFGLEESRQVTTSPLHFQNLLWRYSTVLHDTGIYEEYYWIKRDRQPGRPDRPRLEPAYTVHYPWVGTRWTVTQSDRLQRPLPPIQTSA